MKISASTRSGMRKFGCNILAVVQQYDTIKDSRVRGAMIGNSKKAENALGELSQPLTDQEIKELLEHADLTGEQRQRIAEELRSWAEREEKDEKT